MSVCFPTPPDHAAIAVRSDVLAVSHPASGLHYELRVDCGATYVRGTDAPTAAGVSSAAWHPAALESVLAVFAANSPVAHWLRQQGVDVISLVLRQVATGALNAAT